MCLVAGTIQTCVVLTFVAGFTFAPALCPAFSLIHRTTIAEGRVANGEEDDERDATKTGEDAAAAAMKTGQDLAGGDDGDRTGSCDEDRAGGGDVQAATREGDDDSASALRRGKTTILR